MRVDAGLSGHRQRIDLGKDGIAIRGGHVRCLESVRLETGHVGQGQAVIVHQRDKLLTQRAPEHRGIVGTDGHPQAPLVQPADRMRGEVRGDPEFHVRTMAQGIAPSKCRWSSAFGNARTNSSVCIADRAFARRHGRTRIFAWCSGEPSASNAPATPSMPTAPVMSGATGIAPAAMWPRVAANSSWV